MKQNRKKVVPATQPRYSKEEFAQRGDAIYESDIRSVIEAGNRGRFVVIDIETGAYEPVFRGKRNLLFSTHMLIHHYTLS